MPEPTGHLLLGLDLGSSGVKATVVHPGEGIVASVSRPVALFSDAPGWAEADPLEWWRQVCDAIAELVTHDGVDASSIAAVAVSGMVPAVVVCDDRGLPVRRAILQNDARATNEIRMLQHALRGHDLLSLTGSVISQQSVAPTIAWLATNEPDVWRTVATVQGSYDWVARQLGAEPHVEQNWAIESGLYDLNLDALDVVRHATACTWPTLLPVRRPGDVVGTVTPTASAATGLRVGTLIVVGGADHVLSAYGAGLVAAGDTLVKLGGAGDILAVSDAPFVDARLYLDAHPVDGKWLPNGCMATSGSLLRWEQHLLGDASLTDLDAEAASSRAGALLALPYFLGEKTPLHDPDLRGVIAGLHLGTTRGDLHRAFLESIAYGFKAHFDVFAQGGLVVGDVRITNGGSKSRLWREILASVLQRDLISIINHPGASYGAAVIAGIGAGLIDDWDYVVGGLEAGEIIAPTALDVPLYEERYQQFLHLSEVTASVSHALARSTT